VQPPAAAAEPKSEPEKPEASAAEASAAPKADAEREAKLKAAADARAARAAAKISAVAGEAAPEAAPPGGEQQSVKTSAADPDREAKLKAAEEARAARAAAKAKAESEEAAAEPKAPSPKQPQLDEAVGLIQALVAGDAIEEAYINELNGHMPTIIVKGDRFTDVASLFKSHPSLDCGYLRNVSGVDYETHLEVVYHLVSLGTKREYAIKVKTDRDTPQAASATPIWATANWNEREIFDLLGIDFTGHPDLRRIMMPDDWVGHPLRKDYEPLDPEV
jgi:NADH-quinone oxidoreductase subunit C